MARRVVVATVGVLLAVILALGTIDTLVWLPQHLAPTTPLDRIYAALAGADDLSFAVLSVPVWFGFWVLFGAL